MSGGARGARCRHRRSGRAVDLAGLLQDRRFSGGRVPDGTFEVLKAHLSDEEILELTYITCSYDMHATMCRALQLEYDDVPERLREVPAPEEDQQTTDFMKAVDVENNPEKGE